MQDVHNPLLGALSFGLAILAGICFANSVRALFPRENGFHLGRALAGCLAMATAWWGAAWAAQLAFLGPTTLGQVNALLSSVLPLLGGILAALLLLAASSSPLRRTAGAAGMLAATALITPLMAGLTGGAGFAWVRAPAGLGFAVAMAFIVILPALMLMPPPRVVAPGRHAAAIVLLAVGLLLPQFLHLAQWPAADGAALAGPGWFALLLGLDLGAAIGLLLVIRHLVDREATAPLTRIEELRAANAALSARLQALSGEIEATARQAEQRCEQLMLSANVGYFDWDLASGKVRYGGAWASMLGYEAQQSERLRQSSDPLLRLCHTRELHPAQRLLRELHAGKREQMRCQLRLRSARDAWQWVLVNAQAVEWQADGSPRRVLGTLADINRIKRVEQLLLAERSLFASGPVIVLTFDADPPHRLRQASSNLQEARGHADHRLPAGQALDELLHPDDTAGLAQAAKRAIGQPEAQAQCEVRLAKADGTWPWYLLHVVADPPKGGPLLRAYLIDINRLKEAESNAAAHNEALQEVVHKMGATQHFMETLQQLTELLQLCENDAESQQIIVQGGRQLFPRWSGALTFAGDEGLMEVAASWGEPFTPAHSEEADCWAVRRGQLHLNNADQAANVLSPVCGHFGGGPALPPGIRHAICAPLLKSFDRPGVLHLIAHETMSEQDLRAAAWGAETLANALKLSLGNLRLRTSLREQAVRDVMTDLYNRRYFDEALSRESSRSQRSSEGLILAIMDIDHFKVFNDNFGHEAGDQVLKTVADQLRSFVRAYDIACRVGGEELAIIMPRVQIDEAQARLNQLREEIGTCALTHNGMQLPPITVSIGVADLNAASPDDLLRRADIALYAAKHSGRNRVQRWTPDLEADSFGAFGRKEIKVPAPVNATPTGAAQAETESPSSS